MNPMSVRAKTVRQRYDQTFRRQAVELWQAGNKTGVAMAAKLGIKANCLYAWRDKLHPPVAPEVAHLRQQRDILKSTGATSKPGRKPAWPSLNSLKCSTTGSASTARSAFFRPLTSKPKTTN